MALLLNQPPDVVPWDDNPATMIARDGIESLDLGFAEPSLNGGSMIQGRSMGAMPPITFQTPTLKETPLPFGAQGWEMRVTEPVNRITWRIRIPPNPQDGTRWISDCTCSRNKIEDIIAQLAKAGLAVPKVKLPNDPIWKVAVYPLPDAARFMDHVLFHEQQHQVDHAWLAGMIIGPWHEWLRIADHKRLRFRHANKFELRAAVGIPGNYATGPERIFRYWQTAIQRSGELYHATAEGAPPTIRVMQSTGTERLSSGENTLHLSIEPTALMTQSPYLPSGPHHGFILKPMSNPISGNENPVAYGTCPARRIDYLGIHTAPNSAVVQVRGRGDTA